MASRDPFVDGDILALDRMAQRRSPVEAMALARGDIEPVDEDFMRQGGAEARTLYPDVDGIEEVASASMALTSLGDFLSELRYDCIDERWPHDENTLLNFAFKNGHHYVEADRAKRGVVSVPTPRGHVRRKVHKFEPWYRAQHGQLCDSPPDVAVRPVNSQGEDRDAAEYGDRVRKWLAGQAFGFQQRSKNAMWMLLGGVTTCMVNTVWDPPDEEYRAQTGMMHRPNLEFDYLSPMEVWTDNRESCVKDMRWIGRDYYLPHAEARALYLDEQRQLRLQPISEVSDPREHGLFTLRALQRFVGREAPWGQNLDHTPIASREEEEEVIVGEWWGRKNLVIQGAYLDGLERVAAASGGRLTVEVLQDGSDGQPALVRFPKGVVVRFSPDGFILEIRDNHIPKGILPFREFKLTQSAGYWPMAWATPLREINTAINWIVSLREEHLVKTAHPTFLEPAEARVSRRASASGTSMRVKYRANRFGSKPEWADPPPMPSDIIQYMGELRELWMEIGARREVSQGTLPARLSGVAVSLLQEADAKQLGFPGNELEDGYADVMRMALAQVQAFFPEGDPRLAKLAGDAPFQMGHFMAADVDEQLDVKVKPGSGIPRSNAAVKQEALELFQAGALVDPVTRMPDYRKLLEVFKFGSWEELYGEDELDRQNARDEEDQILALDPMIAMELLAFTMESGQLPPELAPSPYDNHLVHEQSHRLRLKQVERDERVHPANRQLLELHWTLTIQGALPLLMQTNPEVASTFMPAPAAEAEGGGEAEASAAEEGEDGVEG